MARRSSGFGSSVLKNKEIIITEEFLLEELVEPLPLIPDTVSVTLLKDVRLKYFGKITGKEYFFNGAGSILSVEREDAELMRDVGKRAGCCGSNISSPYFQIEF